MSTTKRDQGTLKTYASLRFRGDALEPGRVTAIIDTEPTLAYRKGEVFKRSRGNEVPGRFGLWLLSSEQHVSSSDLDDHLRYLLAILFPRDSEEKIIRLQTLMREERLHADVGCFWYGKSGARPPQISDAIRAALARLPAEIETDFWTD